MITNHNDKDSDNATDNAPKEAQEGVDEDSVSGENIEMKQVENNDDVEVRASYIPPPPRAVAPFAREAQTGARARLSDTRRTSRG